MNSLRKTVVTILIIVAAGVWKTGEAVMPPSTSVKSEAKSERQMLMDFLDKLERHEEENISFLREIKHEMKGL